MEQRHRFMNSEANVLPSGFPTGLQNACLSLSLKPNFNYKKTFPSYASQPVYPFYLLHQLIMIASGYFIVQWELPVLLKLVLLIIVCFGSLFLLYYFLSKRFMLTRILYGLKPKEKQNGEVPAV